MITVSKQSLMSRKMNTMQINCTREQYEAWVGGEGLIQNMLPNATPTQREFLLTGMSAAEQDGFFGDDE
jgi:hypothetical protein